MVCDAVMDDDQLRLFEASNRAAVVGPDFGRTSTQAPLYSAVVVAVAVAVQGPWAVVGCLLALPATGIRRIHAR